MKKAVELMITIELLEIYGPCISTASWTDWPRHRKVLAAPFNETIMEFVWKESLKQARGLLQAWTSCRKPTTLNVAKDTRTLSLNVLAATGFHRSYDFHSSSQPGTDEARTYRDALQTVLDNAILLMLIPPRFLSFPLLPASWARVGEAAADFKRHMIHMLDEETSLINQGRSGSGTLMTSFVRAHDSHQKDKGAGKIEDDKAPKGLTVDEIFGNIFVINFAGHDTTANTLAFTVLLLAAHPDIQDWVSEEVCDFVKSQDGDGWDYGDLYPVLTRCRAVMVCTPSLTGIIN